GADAVAADQQVGALAMPLGEMHADFTAVLLDVLERVAEMITRRLDGCAQQALEPVPRGEDLPQVALADHTTRAVDGDPLVHRDPEVAGAGAAPFEPLQELGVPGDAGAAPAQLDCGTFEHAHVPADLAQERGGEQARHRSADDDGAPAQRA